MFELIEKLRQKPDSTKALVAFSVSLAFAGTIFLVWFTVVLPDIRQDNEIKEKMAKIEPSPFSTFFGNIANSFYALKDQVVDVKTKISEMSNTPVYYNSTSTKTNTGNSNTNYSNGTASTTTVTATSTSVVGE